MNKNIAIKVEHLSKVYQLGQIGTGTISRDLERWYARMRGKEDPFLRIGESNQQNTRSESNLVWSLRDINFEIEQGDAVGIIGRNGAGKSTLLKILSKVTAPTTGKISGKGRIASLLEVGTGFHPELSGRENIFLNGAILGMRKKEIQHKLDEIVDFAGIERYLDTPVKRYSSGMYVRLAFAVAAHLESEILIIDEVLAVGDAEFQKKCLGKMGEVSEGEGRTVLFVSHNMKSIEKLCNKGLLIENGKMVYSGDIKKAIERYSTIDTKANYTYNIPRLANFAATGAFLNSITVEDLFGNIQNEIQIGQSFQVTVSFTITKSIADFVIAVGIIDSFDVQIQTSWSLPSDLSQGKYKATFKQDLLILSTGIYYLNVGLSKENNVIQYLEREISFEISTNLHENIDKSILKTEHVGLILNPMEINITKL